MTIVVGIAAATVAYAQDIQQKVAASRQGAAQSCTEQKAVQAYRTVDEKTHAVHPTIAQQLGDKRAIGFMPIPGTSAFIRLFGTVKVTGVYDQHAAKNGPAYDHFMAANILGPGEESKKGEFRLHARESSFGIETIALLHWVNGGDINFGTYVDMDFFGNSQTEESLFTPLALRVKRAYITLGSPTHYWLIGQKDTIFSDGDAEPETADFSGPTGLSGGRRPQIRYTCKGSSFIFEAALENPEGECINTDGDIKYAERASAGYFASDPLPDITLAVQYNCPRGSVKARAMGRKIRLMNAEGEADISSYGWGVGLSGVYGYMGQGVTQSKVFVQATYGKGIGRYLGDANGYALYLDTASRRTHPMVAFGGVVGVKHYWNEEWRWRSTVAFGLTRILPHASLVSHAIQVPPAPARYAQINKMIRSFQVNTFFSPFGPGIDVGIEYLRGERILKVQNGPDKGVIDRFIVTIKGAFSSQSS
ncbi:MAG: hypothetical protein LBQ26_00290 [Holosporales bacterium]|jgi:hypothetical protein|nr:hypothetical protein [Holosporales bacterium]